MVFRRASRPLSVLPVRRPPRLSSVLSVPFASYSGGDPPVLVACGCVLFVLVSVRPVLCVPPWATTPANKIRQQLYKVCSQAIPPELRRHMPVLPHAGLSVFLPVPIVLFPRHCAP